MKKIYIPRYQVKKIISHISRYMHLIIFILFSSLIAIVIMRTGESIKVEPTANQVEEMTKKTVVNKIDQSSINKLKELESKNVSLEALFDNGRTNPFEN